MVVLFITENHLHLKNPNCVHKTNAWLRNKAVEMLCKKKKKRCSSKCFQWRHANNSAQHFQREHIAYDDIRIQKQQQLRSHKYKRHADSIGVMAVCVYSAQNPIPIGSSAFDANQCSQQFDWLFGLFQIIHVNNQWTIEFIIGECWLSGILIPMTGWKVLFSFAKTVKSMSASFMIHPRNILNHTEFFKGEICIVY